MHSDVVADGFRSVPDRPSNARVVRSCSLLNGIEAQAVDRLIANSFTAYAERGELIWSAGSQADFCGVVGVGFVKMTKSLSNGSEMSMELLGPGQAFGLMSVVEGRDYPLSASAATNCWYLKIPSGEIRDVYERSGALKDSIVRNLGPRLRKAHDMMSRLSSGKVEERIAAVLFVLADSYGQDSEEGVRLDIPLARTDIAEMAGTTTETAIRVMSRWQKQGVLVTDRRLITIRDQGALAEILRS